MSSAKWRPFCLGPNVLKAADSKCMKNFQKYDFKAAKIRNAWWLSKLVHISDLKTISAYTGLFRGEFTGHH